MVSMKPRLAKLFARAKVKQIFIINTDREDPNFLYCHYLTYIEKNGFIWELDGRIPVPQNKGKMTDPS